MVFGSSWLVCRRCVDLKRACWLRCHRSRTVRERTCQPRRCREILWTTFTQLQNICFPPPTTTWPFRPPDSPPSGDYSVIDEKRNTTGMRNTRNPANSEITKQTQSHKWTVHRIDKPIRFSQNSAALRAHERESRQTARVVGYSETIKPLQGSRPNFSRCLVDIAGPEIIGVARLRYRPLDSAFNLALMPPLC